MNLTEQRNDRLQLNAYNSGVGHGKADMPFYHNPFCPINEGGMWCAWDDGWIAGRDTTQAVEEDELVLEAV